MDAEEMVALCRRHTLYTWSAGARTAPLPVVRAEGVWFWTAEGQRFLDFNSQAMCVNVGHSHPAVLAAMKEALDGLVYISPGAASEARAELGRKLAELMPGDLDATLFTLGGADANENAVRMARAVTGRFKVLSRYRSYHGATNLALQLTGDPRRWPAEPGAPGVVHVLDPWPYGFSFGTTEEEITARSLEYLEEVIAMEGPQTIAAMVVESVTGTNGVLAPPVGYLRGLKALLERHGILLVCDEVMAGFGRTGRWFGFEHEGIVPDLVTMAKGLTSAYFPLGAVGVRRPVADYYEDHVLAGGLTYNSHPLGLRTALAVIRVIEEEGLLENARRLGAVMGEEMARLKAAHPSVGAVRNLGLFGMIDLRRNARGEPMAPYGGGSEAMTALGRFFREQGLYTFIRWGSFTCIPPLVITEEQLREGFAVIDRGLTLTDAHFEG
jgi:taurine---2-oxoglutarate transaminase